MDLTPEDKITNEMVEAYMGAVFENWWIDLRRDELVPDVRAGLAAALPLLKAAWQEEQAAAYAAMRRGYGTDADQAEKG